jgi:hypothetical protein
LVALRKQQQRVRCRIGTTIVVVYCHHRLSLRGTHKRRVATRTAAECANGDALHAAS